MCQTEVCRYHKMGKQTKHGPMQTNVDGRGGSGRMNATENGQNSKMICATAHTLLTCPLLFTYQTSSQVRGTLQLHRKLML